MKLPPLARVIFLPLGFAGAFALTLLWLSLQPPMETLTARESHADAVAGFLGLSAILAVSGYAAWRIIKATKAQRQEAHEKP